MAEAGHRHENDRNNGVAHFLEHMMFKVIRLCLLLPLAQHRRFALVICMTGIYK